MNNKTQDFITTVLSTFGITLSVQDITQILNLVLLIVSIVNILIVVGLRVYNLIKNKKYEDIPPVIEQGIEDVKDEVNKYENK